MKNPLLDAIRNMKAKRIAIVVGDADELGLPDMKKGLMSEEMPETEGEEMPEGHEEMDPEEHEEMMAESEGLEDEGEESEEDDGSETMAANDSASEAERVMGRKPFDKKRPVAESSGADSGDVPESVAREFLDEEYVDRMKKGGRKPQGLFARAQMNMANKFGKK